MPSDIATWELVPTLLHMSYATRAHSLLSRLLSIPHRVFSTLYCPDNILICSAINISCSTGDFVVHCGSDELMMHSAFLQVLDVLADLVPDQHGVKCAVQGLLSSGAGPHHLLHCWSAVHLRACLLWWNHAG